MELPPHCPILILRWSARLPLVGRGRLRQLAATWQCQGGKCHCLDGEICPPLLPRPLPPPLSASVMRAIGQANQHVDWRGPERESANPKGRTEAGPGRGACLRRRPTFIPSLGTRSVRPARRLGHAGARRGRIRWRWIRRFHVHSNRRSNREDKGGLLCHSAGLRVATQRRMLNEFSCAPQSDLDTSARTKYVKMSWRKPCR